MISPPDRHLWVFSKESINYQPVLYDDRVFVVGEESGSTSLYAIDLDNGNSLWEFRSNCDITSPVVSEETVYVGYSTVGTLQHRADSLYALDATDGTKQWREKIDDKIFSALTLNAGTLYFVSGSNTLHAVDVNTTTELWQQQLQRNQPEGIFNGDFSPVVDNGIVYVGLPDSIKSSSSKLYAVNSENGIVEWDFEIPSYRGRVTPLRTTVVDGTVYVGTPRTLYAVDTLSGEEKWQFETPSRNERIPNVLPNQSHVPLPIVTNEKAYIGTQTGLYAVDVTQGTQEWHFPTWNLPANAIAILGQTVCVGTPDGLYTVDATTGDGQWRWGVGRGGTHSVVASTDAIYMSNDSCLRVIPVEDYAEQCQNCGAELNEYGEVDYCPECGSKTGSSSGSETEVYDK
ncbi:PQQ-binding-like beta-propeller repeat protein [Halorubrum sp. C191]|uniref:PQQ-binding-like beta-propeller repeat protein n=1 Tax=Halorubrum sp. C191 TaxID=1383842 RepID=UPI0013046E44|nr:PQQ-binding-like beta-propeller repeat protein [Halorubrum sp. C191]